MLRERGFFTGAAAMAAFGCGYAASVQARRVALLARGMMTRDVMLSQAAREIASLQFALAENMRTTHDTLVAVRLAADAGADITEELDGMISGLADGLAVMGEHRA